MSELLPWLKLVARRPGRLVNGALLMLLTLASGIGLLALSGWFITATALTGLILAAGGQASLNLYVPGGGIRFFAVSRTVGRYLERVYNHDTVLRLLTDIRVRLFRDLAASRRSGVGGLPSSGWLSRLTSDVDALDTLYLRLLAPAALALLLTLVIGAVSLWTHDTVTALWVTGLLLGALVLATALAWLRTRSLVGRQDQQKDALRSEVIEHLDGLAELTAAGRAGKHAAVMLRHGSRINREQATAEGMTGWVRAGSQLLVNIAVVVALWGGLALFQSGGLSGPVLVLLPIAILGLVEVYAALPEAFSQLAATEASARRINRDCSNGNTEAGIASRQKPESVSKALELDQVTLRQGHHHAILSHFDLSLEVGEWLLVTGSSGSGKSTLADAVAGLLTPAHGEIRSLPLAYLTQQTVLFEDTLAANLRLGRPDCSDEALWSVLALVELDGRFASESKGLDTWLGSRGSNLSGGEARRVALARVLLSEAALLVLDEPFTGVDEATRARICQRMTDTLAGKAVLALAHHRDALPPGHRTVSL